MCHVRNCTTGYKHVLPVCTYDYPCRYICINLNSCFAPSHSLSAILPYLWCTYVRMCIVCIRAAMSQVKDTG